MYETKPVEALWEVTLSPLDESNAQWRARLLEYVRPVLKEKWQASPSAREFAWQAPLHTIRARRLSGADDPRATIRLAFATDTARFGPASGRSEPTSDLPMLRLPDAADAQLGERLVGVEGIAQEVLLRFHCAWDGLVDSWHQRIKTPVPDAVRTTLEESCPLILFHGDPGTGKSALARVLADRYCREAGIEGTLLWLGTDARGNGLVGDFGNRVRNAFETAAKLSPEQFRCIVIEEADALAMRRSEAHSHQEDRAGTATLLQCLDRLRGHSRLAVFMTTNLLESVDAAVRRRGVAFHFPRPDREARKTLLRQWLAPFRDRDVERAVHLSRGMTPADIERTLQQAWLAALRQNDKLTPALVQEYLRRAERTGRV